MALAASEPICRILLIVIISWVRTFFTYVHYAKGLEGLLCALHRDSHSQPRKSAPCRGGAPPSHPEPVSHEWNLGYCLCHDCEGNKKGHLGTLTCNRDCHGSLISQG